MKLIKIKFKNKSGNQVEMEIADDTIKRVVRNKRMITLVTPLRDRGFKNQTIIFSQKNFDEIMEQLDGD